MATDTENFVQRLLPRHEGVEFQAWCTKWLEEMSQDLHSVIVDDPDAMLKRNERLSSYLGTLTTLKAIYRQRARKARDEFYQTPRNGTVRDYEEQRDNKTAPFRYMHDLIDNLHEDCLKRISTSQTNLRVSDMELGAQHAAQ